MPTIYRKDRPRSRADHGQGMVEFALVLPLLLLLVFGVIELGRLLVIYSSVSAGSREAARYASAAGTSENDVPYYLDQTGMVEAAQRVAILTAIQVDAGPDIWYDHGPGTSTFEPVSANDVRLGDRVNIRVRATYNPMLGLTPLRSFPISSVTSRTIVKEVAVGPGAGGGGGSTNNPPTVTIMSPSNGAIFNEGDSIIFSCIGHDPDGETVTMYWQEGGSVLAGPSSDSVGFTTISMSPGAHTLTCRGTDPSGAEDTESITIEINQRPVLYIEAPSNGTQYDLGTSITFSARVEDDDPVETNNVIWYEGTTEIGRGLGIAYTPASVGVHQIRVEYTDAQGAAAAPKTVSVVILQPLPPTLSIISPLEGAQFGINNMPVVFQGRALNYRTTDISNLITWTSNLGDPIPTGAIVSANLRTGVHIITASITDPLSGLTTTATRRIEVLNVALPVVRITSPTNLDNFLTGDNIHFTATAVDGNNNNVAAQLRWYSSIDGQFGTGPDFYYSRLTGSGAQEPHTITASVTVGGLTGTASVVIVIEDIPNTPPTVVITSPADGISVREGTTIQFSAVVTDAEQTNLAATLRWIDDLGTNLFTGPSFSTSTLSVGPHVITATVRDMGGLTASDTVNVTVRALVCPTPGTPSFTEGSNNRYDKITWPILGPTNETYVLEELSITLPVNATVNTIQLETTQLTPAPNGRQWYATGNPIWTGMFPGGGQMSATFIWAPDIHRNQMPYLLIAKFEGCPRITVECTSATVCNQQ